MKIKLLTALLALLACTSVAQVRNYSYYVDYRNYTYTWSEEGGGNLHTDTKITDKVTHPGQMGWFRNGTLMWEKIFPGTIRISDETNVSYKWPITGDDRTPVEGFTCILQTIKPNVNVTADVAAMYKAQGIDTVLMKGEPKDSLGFSKAINSMQLMTNTTECDDAYILSFSGTFDRFYFAAKGKPRLNKVARKNDKGEEIKDNQGNIIYDFVPYPCDWELFSPTGNALYINEDETTDSGNEMSFYDSMIKGGVYKISHDCSNVVGLRHFFTVNPGEGKEPTLTNVTLMVPKNRMQNWDQQTHPGFRWPNTKEDSGTRRDADGDYTWYNPDFCPRLAIYRASLAVKPAGMNVNKYYAKLNWVSNLKGENGLNWPGGETYKIIRSDGKTFIVSDKEEYTDTLDRKETAYSMTYKVVCQPTGTDQDNPVEAVTDPATVYVPGLQGVITEYSYRSRFEKEANVNSYKNSLTIIPGAYTAFRLYCATTKFGLLGEETTSSLEEMARVDIDNRDPRQGILYLVDYNGPMREDENYRFDDEQLDEGGHLSSMFAPITINDYRLESTKLPKEQRIAYFTYFLSTFKSDGTWTTPEKIAIVPVYSGELIEPEYGPKYTYAKIRKDMVLNNPILRGGLKETNYATTNFIDYTHTHVSEQNINSANRILYKNNKIAQQGVNSAKFNLYNYVEVPVEEYYNGELQQRMEYRKEPDGGDVVGEYIVNSPWGVNTYGTKPINIARVGVGIYAPKHTWQPYGTEGIEGAFAVGLEIHPQMSPMFPSNQVSTNGTTTKAQPYVFYYNVSNYDDDYEEDFLVNSYEDVAGNGWATNYAEIKETYPIGTSRTNQTNIYEVRVKSTYGVEEDEDIGTQQTYYVRMYYTPTYTKNTPSRTQEFYIADNDTYFEVFNRVFTGVNDVNVDKSVVDVKYYNLMGVCSDKPFDGANIKVERHADGTTTSTKMMK